MFPKVRLATITALAPHSHPALWKHHQGSQSLSHGSSHVGKHDGSAQCFDESRFLQRKWEPQHAIRHARPRTELRGHAVDKKQRYHPLGSVVRVPRAGARRGGISAILKQPRKQGTSGWGTCPFWSHNHLAPPRLHPARCSASARSLSSRSRPSRRCRIPRPRMLRESSSQTEIRAPALVTTCSSVCQLRNPPSEFVLDGSVDWAGYATYHLLRRSHRQTDRDGPSLQRHRLHGFDSDVRTSQPRYCTLTTYSNYQRPGILPCLCVRRTAPRLAWQ